MFSWHPFRNFQNYGLSEPPYAYFEGKQFQHPGIIVLLVAFWIFSQTSRQFTIAMNLYFNNYNPGHNIFELYNVLVQVRLATSKPKLDILYKKLGIRVALRVAKRLNIENLRKLRILKNSQIWVDSPVPSIPCRNKTLEIAVKTHAKVDIKLFIFCPILLDFSRIVQDCLSKQIFPHNSVHFPSNVFTFSVTSKLSPIVKKNVKEVSCVQF